MLAFLLEITRDVAANSPRPTIEASVVVPVFGNVLTFPLIALAVLKCFTSLLALATCNSGRASWTAAWPVWWLTPLLSVITLPSLTGLAGFVSGTNGLTPGIIREYGNGSW